MATPERPRRLRDLRGVGPSILRDFELLGVRNVDQLAKKNGRSLYLQLMDITGKRQDPCVEDVFRCAVAQAKNPDLPRDQCDWWYWSRQRKQEKRPK
jgi:hypothetical protein